MIAFMKADEFMKKTKMTLRTYYRRKKRFDIFVVKLANEYVLVSIENNQITPISPANIKEFKDLFQTF